MCEAVGFSLVVLHKPKAQAKVPTSEVCAEQTQCADAPEGILDKSLAHLLYRNEVYSPDGDRWEGKEPVWMI